MKMGSKKRKKTALRAALTLTFMTLQNNLFVHLIIIHFLKGLSELDGFTFSERRLLTAFASL
jgi:hypothetical protein